MNGLVELLSRKGSVFMQTVGFVLYAWSKGAPSGVLYIVGGVGAIAMMSRAAVELRHGRIYGRPEADEEEPEPEEPKA